MKLTIIIPCYNEASRGIGTKGSLTNRLVELMEFKDYEIIFVNDGSSDNTYSLIDTFIKSNKMSNWSIVGYKNNQGKGSALKLGSISATGDYIMYMDADLAVPLKYIHKVERYLQSDTCYIASRFTSKSKIVEKRNIIRRAMSFCARFTLSFAFNLGVSDTQCGFKVFPSWAIKKSLPHMRGSKWLYDVELLYFMKCLGLNIVCFPVVWDNMETETRLKSLSAISNSVKDLIILYRSKKHIQDCTKF